MGKNKKDREKEISHALKNENLYTAPCVNWKSWIEYISEKISENGIDKININKITRRSPYKVDHKSSNNDSNRHEEIFAKQLYNEYKDNDFFGFGKILDFQMPLKNVQSDKAGKVDLVSYCKSNTYFIELKWKTAKDTLLRCALEAYTYVKTVNAEKFFKDFGKKQNKIIPLVMIFQGTLACEMAENKELYPNLHKLIKELGVKIAIIERINISNVKLI